MLGGHFDLALVNTWLNLVYTWVEEVMDTSDLVKDNMLWLPFLVVYTYTYVRLDLVMDTVDFGGVYI